MLSEDDAEISLAFREYSGDLLTGITKGELFEVSVGGDPEWLEKAFEFVGYEVRKS